MKKKKHNTTQITGEYIITGNTGTAVVRYLCTGEVKYHCHTAAAVAAAAAAVTARSAIVFFF